jgi:hypothetical protein
MGDADRYYHLRLAQLTASNGLVHELPQVDGLGWKYFFPDKEFFFHLMGGLAYRINGEWGTLSLAPLSAIAVLLALYFTFCSKRIFNLATWQSALLATVTVLLPTSFTFRLFLLRPHLFGILFWLLSTLGLLFELKWIVFAGSFLFALSYHAFYLPLIPAALYAVFPIGLKGKDRWKLVAMAPLGVLAGTLLNPYFPGNLSMGWIHLKIALGVGLPPLNRGQELNRLPFETALWDARWQLSVILFGIVATILKKDQGASSTKLRSQLFICFLALGLGVLYFLSPRTNEYWVPTCGILLASSLAMFSSKLRNYFTAAIIPLSILISLPDAYSFYQNAMTVRYPGSVENTFAAISKIPANASGSLVFNCNWTAGSLIFYARPDLRFIDLLEPALLYFKNPDAHALRDALNNGAIQKPSEAIRQGFGARYVICDNPALKDLLERDAKVLVLGPTAPVGSPLPVAYEIRD